MKHLCIKIHHEYISKIYNLNMLVPANKRIHVVSAELEADKFTQNNLFPFQDELGCDNHDI